MTSFSPLNYLFSIMTAILTGVLAVFIVLAASKYISVHFLDHSTATIGILLYDATSSSSITGQVITQYPATPGDVDKDQQDSSVLKTKPAAITAAAYLVIAMNQSTSSIQSGDILADAKILEKNSEQALPIASLSKLATAVVSLNLLDQDVKVVIDKKILSTYENDPGGLRDGEQIKVGQLLYPLLMVSSNDAGEALAQSYPPGRQWFIKAMNDWAYSIGAYNTYFADPTGLSSENISSAHDVAIMLAWIYIHHPELMTITDTKVKSLGAHTWVSPTQLLNLSSYLGGKNGYLPQAGETSVSLFRISTSTRYVVVTLDSQNRDQDILNLLARAHADVSGN